MADALVRAAACPDRDKHTKDPTEPAGYVAWHEWADWMAKRSRHTQCPTCQLWVIWAPTGDELGFDPSTLPLCIVGGRRRKVHRKRSASEGPQHGDD